MTNGPATSQQLLSLHYLRALAALMVVACHVYVYRIVEVADPRHTDWLAQGVAIFFVISGFVMVESTRGRQQGPGGFLLRRLVRVVPLYWLATIAWGLLWGDLAPARLLPSLAFVFPVDPATGLARAPVLEVGWSLNFEMLFYLLFAAALLLAERWRVPAVTAMLAAFAGLALLPGMPAQASYLASPLLLLFAGGMGIAQYGLKAPPLALPLGLGLLALVPQVSDSVTAGVLVPALLVVLGARGLDGRLPHWRLPALLGDASYAIYLSHVMTLQAVAWFLAPLLPPVVLLPLAMGASCAVGVLVHRAVEVPLTRALRLRVEARRMSVPQAA